MRISDWSSDVCSSDLDHILIDAAQDTNDAQWTIAKKLTEELFAGEGARGGRRTMFAVGAFKQAIFRFQCPDPREFESALQWFDRELRQGGSVLHDRMRVVKGKRVYERSAYSGRG